jgi:tRNA pseudouridine38-40 synthase
MALESWRAQLAWRGTAYIGWQRQPNGTSIQEVVEASLGAVCGVEHIPVVAAGRTDSGVHALRQTVAFRTENRSLTEIRNGLNFWLPDDIKCLEVAAADPGFNPRRDAIQKLYRYRILRRWAPCPFRFDLTWHRRKPLDIPGMMSGAAALVGEHDFTSFRASGCAAKIPVRAVHAFEIRHVEDEILFEIRGDGFLRHQVRIMVGTLVEVGRGRRPSSAVQQVLEARDRQAAGPTAPGHGLTLVRVEYPEAISP